MNTFSDRLAVGIRQKKTAALVGLDPRWAQIPEALKAGKTESNPQDVAEVFEDFCKKVVDVVAPLVPAVKPQSAFFEQYGPLGMQCLANVIHYASEKGLLVILDAKRNDVGSTASAYANGLIGPGGVSPRIFLLTESLSTASLANTWNSWRWKAFGITRQIANMELSAASLAQRGRNSSRNSEPLCRMYGSSFPAMAVRAAAPKTSPALLTSTAWGRSLTTRAESFSLINPTLIRINMARQTGKAPSRLRLAT